MLISMQERAAVTSDVQVAQALICSWLRGGSAASQLRHLKLVSIGKSRLVPRLLLKQNGIPGPLEVVSFWLYWAILVAKQLCRAGKAKTQFDLSSLKLLTQEH